MSRSVSYSDIDTLKCLLRALYGAERDELAWELLTRFGDIRGVFTASYESLCAVDGVTERVALFLSSVLPIKRQAVLRDRTNASITSRSAAERFMRLYFSVDSAATAAIVSLDAHGKIKFVYNRELNSVRDIVAELCKTDTDRFILMKFAPDRDRAEIAPPRKDMLDRLKRFADILAVEFVGYAELAGDGSVAAHWFSGEDKFPHTSLGKKVCKKPLV